MLMCTSVRACACVGVCARTRILLAVLEEGGGRRAQRRAGRLRRQQRRFEGAASAALAGAEHLAGEMVKGVVSFWGGADPSVRTCTRAHTHTHKQTV